MGLGYREEKNPVNLRDVARTLQTAGVSECRTRRMAPTRPQHALDMVNGWDTVKTQLRHGQDTIGTMEKYFLKPKSHFFCCRSSFPPSQLFSSPSPGFAQAVEDLDLVVR
ncbi:unnamed protein product [Prunus armeniaca]